MTTEKFYRLYTGLVTAFRRYHDAPRSPETVPQLGAARWELELARKAITPERRQIEATQRRRGGVPSRTTADPDVLARLRVDVVGFST